MKLKKVLIIGAGTMGKGIAQWFASREVDTYLVDSKIALAKSAEKDIHKIWQRLLEKKELKSAQLKKFKDHLSTIELSKVPKDVDLVVEAVFEDREVKRELFSGLDKKLSKKTIFASNTSSFLIASLCAHLPPERKKKFVGIHFFNPAPLMKLVEIISCTWTEKKLTEDLRAYFEQEEKVAVVCQDSPGFIVNRVARNFYGEAFRIAGLFDQESFTEIDKVMTEVGGFKMGPYRLMDLIGIDINFAVTQSVWQAYFQNARFSPHPLQKMMVESGRLGKKTGEGFYSYE